MGNLCKFSVMAFLLQAFWVRPTTVITNIASSSGANQSLFVRSNGSLWGLGASGYGQLASTNGVVLNRPEEIMVSNVVAMACGNRYSLLVENNGSVWGMGDNGQGSLGLTNVSATNVPVQLPLTNVTAVAAGLGHSLFLEADGSLWGVGNDTYGQLGDGANYSEVPVGPRQIEQVVADGVTAVAAGQYHSLFIKSDGSLWGMGSETFGQLGDGHPENIPFYPDLSSFTNLPEEIVASNVIAVAAGGAHSLFLKSDSSLWAMGYNYYGQLGDGTLISTNRPEMIVTSNVTAIAAGAYHSLFLKSDGSLWAMGDNDMGQLGNGNFGSGDRSGYATRPEEIVASNVVAIAAGEYHSLFLKSDGSLWAMGLNSNGQLGDGFFDYSTIHQGTATPEQILPPPPPVLFTTTSAGTNLQFDAECGFGGVFYLLTSTHLDFPMNKWTPIWTNIISDRSANHFSATLTNAETFTGNRFYILRSQYP
jgi:alpha-tubulin suppressor-like RCC1 family protein